MIDPGSPAHAHKVRPDHMSTITLSMGSGREAGVEAVLAAADRAALQAEVDGGLAHCVHALHGIDLPWRPTAPWGVDAQVRAMTAHEPLLSQRQLHCFMPGMA